MSGRANIRTLRHRWWAHGWTIQVVGGCALLAAGLSSWIWVRGTSEHEPRERPTLLHHALYVVEDVAGEFASIADITGDGLGDLVVVRGARSDDSKRLDLVCGARGLGVRTLWRPASGYRLRELCAGPDLDGDGHSEVLVSCASLDRRWRVELVSTRDGAVQRSWENASETERLGASLAFLGDLDGDGVDEIALGAPREVNDDELERGVLESGTVLVHSGASGAELLRVGGGRNEREFGAHVAALGDLDGDGVREWLVQGAEHAGAPALIHSGLAPAPARVLDVGPGWGRAAGDLDGDGAPDMVFETATKDGRERRGGARCFSGSDGRELLTFAYPDRFPSEHVATHALGDLDGDGFAEIGVGEPNFHLRGPGDPGFTLAQTIPIDYLSLAAALSIDSDPWCAFTHESGCAWIYSGRTRQVIWGAWAPPGSREGLGYHMASIADVSGDGWPDIAVTSGDKLFVLRGPGRDPTLARER